MPGRRRFVMPRIRISRRWLWPAVSGALVATVVAAGAVAAIETDTVTSFWRGLWWSISLITTVGFIGAPPRTAAGAIVSVALMVIGFLLLALVSASLASLFVREEDAPREARESSSDEAVLGALGAIERRLAVLEAALVEPRGDEADRGDSSI